MPNFKGNSRATLQPRELAVPYGFNFSNCSSPTANDGFLPYNDNITSFEVKSYDEDGTEVSDLINYSNREINQITVGLNYPSTSGPGRYKLTFILTLDSGAVLEADFFRVYAEDL